MIIRISTIIYLISIHDLMFDVNILIGIGSSSSNSISTSKIIKITAIRKNRDENGSRAEFLGQTRIRMGIYFLGFH
jgi:hypothetical protein